MQIRILGLLPLVWLALASMMILRFALTFGTGPTHAEALNWVSSQTLPFSYAGPQFLSGWLLAPVVAVLGDEAWALRALATVFGFAASLFLVLTVQALVRKTPNTGAQLGFTVLALTSPGFWVVGLLYTEMTVMMAFLSLGLWLVVEALLRRPGEHSQRWWLMAGLAFALAFSAHAMAALWLLALVPGLVLHKQGRSHFRHTGARAGAWAGAALILAALALFFVWNALNGRVSFQPFTSQTFKVAPDLQLVDRLGRLGAITFAAVLLSGLTTLILCLRNAAPLLRHAPTLLLALFAVLPMLVLFTLNWFWEVPWTALMPSCLSLSVLGACLWPQSGLRRWPLLAALPSAILAGSLLLPIKLREPRLMLMLVPGPSREDVQLDLGSMLGWQSSLDTLSAYRDEAYPGYGLAGSSPEIAAQIAFHAKQTPEEDGQTPLMLLTPSFERGLELLQSQYCIVLPLSPWPVNHRGGRIAEPYIFTSPDGRLRPDCR